MANRDDSQHVLRRRAFLAGATAATMSLGRSIAKPRLDAGETDRAFAPSAGEAYPGLVMRERQPPNFEFPFATLDSSIVPNNRFYVRSHFPVPKIDRSAWRLKVEGHVRQNLDISYDDLLRLPARTVTATLECAGNSRGFLIPKAKGVLWELGAVGNAEWTGVPLSSVLDQAGLRPGVVDVVLEGTDRGEINDDPTSPGPVNFARSLPLAKCRRPEVLLAYKMNGEDLPSEHGAPIRVIVPGWYGVASVKWLTRISVSASPFRGYWQTTQYAYWKREFGHPTLVPVTELQVKSEIARPCLHEIVPANATYRVYGAAWAGESDVTRVELSSDGGRAWQPARLLGKTVPFAWRLWSFEWKTPTKPGAYQLMAKATDARGRSQPAGHNRDQRAYMIHHTLPVEVEVR